LSLLEVGDLFVHYGRSHVLRGVDLTLAPGETAGVIGETGSGKSTLARAILGLVRPSSGRIVIDGSDVAGFGQRQWRAFRRRGVLQYVFQDPLRSLDPDLTVGESLAEPLRILGRRGDVQKYLDRVRLDTSLLDRLPAELSGGQRQRVAVARALVTDPALVLLDEPVSALDSANRVRVLELLKELRDAGTALLFISHDLGSVAGIADRIAVLHQGEIVEDGPTHQVITEPRHEYTRLLISSVPTLRKAVTA
jgi:ABC-type glutathione transport system ATPase component